MLFGLSLFGNADVLNTYLYYEYSFVILPVKNYFRPLLNNLNFYVRTIYDPRIKLNFVLNVLDKQIIDQINPSTARNWLQKGEKKIIENYLLLPDTHVQYDFDTLREIIQYKNVYRTVKIVCLIARCFHKEGRNIIMKEFYLNNDFRKRIIPIIERYRDQFSLKEICAVLGITTNRYHAWNRNIRCVHSLRELCRLKAPNQLLSSEVTIIKKYMNKYYGELQTKTAVYAQMVRDQSAFMSLPTFFEYTRFLGYTKRTKKAIEKKGFIGASKPFEYLHMDASRVKLANNDKAWIFAIKDNYSKAILGIEVCTSSNAKAASNNLMKVVKKFGLESAKQIKLITDDGSENKADVKTALLNLKSFVHYFSLTDDFPHSNSCIESFFHTLKTYYLKEHHLYSFETFKNFVIEAVYHYNYKRLRPELNCRAPMEVINDVKLDFSIPNMITQASSSRITQNQQFDCHRFCITNDIDHNSVPNDHNN